MIMDDHGLTRAGVDPSLMWNELIVNKGPTIGIQLAHFGVGRWALGRRGHCGRRGAGPGCYDAGE
jgi:hypothetical protein